MSPIRSVIEQCYDSKNHYVQSLWTFLMANSDKLEQN